MKSDGKSLTNIKWKITIKRVVRQAASGEGAGALQKDGKRRNENFRRNKSLMDFFLTLTSVGVLLLYAVPGFILSRTKAVTTDSLPAFSKVLMYVCQPCLTLYTFDDIDFTSVLFRDMVMFFFRHYGIAAVFDRNFLSDFPETPDGGAVSGLYHCQHIWKLCVFRGSDP